MEIHDAGQNIQVNPQGKIVTEAEHPNIDPAEEKHHILDGCRTSQQPWQEQNLTQRLLEQFGLV